MVFAQEHIVIAEHEEQVRGAQNHHQFHEGDHTGVARHGACGNFVFLSLEQQSLPPVDEVAAVACAKQVQHHDHHPEPE